MMYLQGTSNVMVIESAKEFQHNLIMPFLDARIIFLKMRYQSEIRNIFQPRYELESVLHRRHNFDIKVIKRAKKYDMTTLDGKKINNFNNLILKINKDWLVKLGIEK